MQTATVDPYPTLLRESALTLTAVRDAAEQVAQRLRSLSASAGPSDSATYFYTRVRVKTKSSIIEKVTRKQERGGDPYYSFRDLTDLVGFRIVTLFDDQLYSAIESVLSIVEAGQKLSQPLFDPNFLWDSFFDARFVCRSSEQNDIYRECHALFVERIKRDYGRAGQTPKAPTNDVISRAPCDGFNPAKYSSAHLTFFARSYVKNTIVLIPVEFQVRAVSEDIWSEINHKFLYKLRSPYAWHPKFAESYAATSNLSKDLKNATDNLSTHVFRFRAAAQETRKNLFVFQSPKTEYHFSFCMSLLDELGTDYTPHFADRISAHSANMSKLRKASLRSKSAAQLISASLTEMDKIISALKANKIENELARQTITQKIRLVEFEIVRLKYIMYQYTQYKPSKSGPQKISKDEIEQLAMELYAEICNIKNSNDLLVRPAAVFLFWKYLISDLFDDFVSLENLRQANEVIDNDISMPPWSVYHILIPNRLAAEMLEEAIAIEGVRTSIRSKGSLLGLDGEIRAKLTEALRLAAKAFERHSRYDPKRGDLIFGSEQDTSPLSEATLVLAIVRFHDKALRPHANGGERKPVYLGLPVMNLVRAIEIVEASLKHGGVKTEENRDYLSGLVKDARRILCDEPAQSDAAGRR